ncbi:MAG: riboflavin biosynthesis protein RibF [Planctomycetota bacterium]
MDAWDRWRLTDEDKMSMVRVNVPFSARRGCIAIGNFDGVHLGHAHMLCALCQMAKRQNTVAVAVTFDPHPIAVLRPEFTPPILTTISERISLLRNAGADEVVVLPVTTGLLQMTAEQFFDEVMCRQFEAIGIVEGPNFHFGRDRRGDVLLLQSLCRNARIECRVMESLNAEGEMISSSRIRELLCQRSLAQAVQLLGHPYRLTGMVRHGSQRGRQIGFPTANLFSIQTLLPAHGVYAALTRIDDRSYPVAVSIGPNPTFGEHREKVECHVDGFSGDLYDRELQIDLLSELRPLQSFGSVNDLIQQIGSDVEGCRFHAARWQTSIQS